MLSLKVSKLVSPQDVLKQHYPQCVPIHEDAFWDVDKKTLSPYKYRLFVLYRYNFQTELVTVVGFNRYELESTIEPTLPQLTFENDPPPKTSPTFVIPWVWNYERLKEAESVSMDALRDRVDLIWDDIDSPHGQMAVILMLLLAGQHVGRFHKKQLAYEAEHWRKHVWPNVDVEEMLSHNIPYNVLLEMQVTPTVEDEQEYFERYPARRSPPPWWISVHFSQLPTTLVDQKPLYEGGFCHLEPGEVGEWVWRKIVIDSHKHKPQEPSEQMRILLAYIGGKVRNKHSRHAPGTKRSISELPPCMQFKDHFPKDAERVAFVAVGKRCGVPLRDIEDLLTELNDRYPQNSGFKKPLKSRFDVAFHYEKGYAPRKCETIYWCPMEGDSYDVKKRNCHQTWFQGRYPQHYSPETQAYKFKGPHSLMQFIK
jgi:hypothetical protein